MLNPEFRRYLWTQMSLQQLVAMLVVLGAVFALAEMIEIGAAKVAYYGFVVIVYLWGTRRAAAAVAEEVRGGTWDSQRMSALDAWPMAWGKLLGSTVFTWYGGLICLGVYVVFSLERLGAAQLGGTAVMLVLTGLIAQAVTLAVSLAFLRKSRDTRNISVSLCHLVGIGALAALASEPAMSGFLLRELPQADRAIWWHGVEFDAVTFFLLSSLLFLGWAVLAVHRLMRAELQHRTLPWGWAAFTLYLVIYQSGFSDNVRGLLLGQYAIGFTISVAMVYLVFLLENKNIVAVKAWIDALRARRWFAMAMLTPSWLVCLCLLAIPIGVVFALWAANADQRNPFQFLPLDVFVSWELVVAILLFLLRDIGVLLFLNFTTWLRRPDLAGALYLAVLYGVGGSILFQLDYDAALAFAVPMNAGNAFLTIAPVLVQVIAVYALLVYRLCRMMRRAAAPAV